MVTKLSIKTSQTLNDTRGMEKVHSFTNKLIYEPPRVSHGDGFMPHILHIKDNFQEHFIS
jgi:hypothetical protein